MAPRSTRRSMAPIPLAGGTPMGCRNGARLWNRGSSPRAAASLVAHGAGQSFGSNLEFYGQLLGGRRGESDTKPKKVPLVNHIISDHVDEPIVVAESMQPDSARVGVLVDETFAMAIDQDAPGQSVRWTERQRALEATQPGRRRPRSDA